MMTAGSPTFPQFRKNFDMIELARLVCARHFLSMSHLNTEATARRGRGLGVLHHDVVF